MPKNIFPVKESLYTSTEVRKLLSISGSQLNNLVDKGIIYKIVPPGKKNGFYTKETVDRYAETLAAFASVYTTSERFIFEQAKDEKDIRATFQIAKQNFGDIAHSLENRINWFKIAPEGEFVLRDSGVIVGYLSMQNLKEGAIEDHIFRKGVGRIKPDDVVPFNKEKPNECYITSIATTLQTGQTHNRLYGALILMNLPNALINLAKQGILISKLWAKSRTVTGIRLCRELGFDEIGYIDNEQIGFMLNIEDGTNPLIMKYKNAIKDNT